MLDLAQELFQSQLDHLKPDIRLIVAHPSYTAHHLMLSSFLHDDRCLYTRFQGKSLDYNQLVEQVFQDEKGDLKKVGLNIRYLILDQCDLALNEAFERLLLTLLGDIQNTSIVIFSRTMPACILSNAQLRQQAQLVPCDDSLMLPDYIQRADQPALLEVKGFGSGRALLNGRLIDNWDGALPRNLFFYLIDRGMATRNQIFETFWPEMPVREATNVFHVTKRKISEVLELDLTYYWSGFYRLSPQIELSYDVALFSQMVQESAVASYENAAKLLVKAIWLYRNNFLTSIHNDIDWVTHRRSELLQTYGDALITLAKSFEASGENLNALGLYVRAALTSPQREDLAGTIMNLYSDLGMYSAALSVYERLETTIVDMLGISPAQWLQDLAREIREKAAEPLHA
jgi:DNA-binding SARP family transcriptional activator